MPSSGGGHPDLGLLAAHAERRLSGAEAAQLDAHLVECSSCYEVFAQTVQFVLEEEAEEPVPEPAKPEPAKKVLPFYRRPAFQIGVGLAAAAALFVSAQQLWRGRPQDGPLVAELAQAMGTTRFIEPRLTGGFEWGRLVVLRAGNATQGLDAHSPAVLTAVAHIRERTQNDSSPAALAALAATYLVSGDIPAAVKALESATAQDPDNPKLQSDLAAAYLVRASRLDEPSDLPKALEAAEKSIEKKDAPIEAWFNRALALEGLHLGDAARNAWDDYLKRDSTSAWAEEAKKRRSELPLARQSTLEADRAHMRAALEAGKSAVETLAEESPAMLRDYFDNVLLYAWADAYLASKPEAAALKGLAELIGDALLRNTGDAMPRDAAVALSLPPSGPSRDPPRTQALGYRALGEAQRLYDAQKPTCTPFRNSQQLLEAGGSPYADWARERVVVACYYYQGKSPAALPELARLVADAHRNSYVMVRGRALWMTALFLGERGEMTVALDRLRGARDAFRAIADHDSEAKVVFLLAQGLGFVGERREAWRDRVRGLDLLGSVRSATRRHEVLREVSLACRLEGLFHAALHVETANVEAARQGGTSARIADVLIVRAVLLEAVRTREAAMADLAEARQMIRQIGDSAMAERVTAFADEAEGRIFAAVEPERATASLSRSVEYFSRMSPMLVPQVRLLLARSQIALRHVDEAEAQLESGIGEMESMRTSQADGSQASFFERGASLFDDMVALQLDKRHDPERALSFVERGRARQLADALRPPPSAKRPSDPSSLDSSLDLDEVKRELPEGFSLVYYASLPDRLVSWVVSREASRFFELPLNPDALRRLAAAHEVALEARAPLQVVREQAARLFDELLRPLSPALADGEALVLIPDGALQSIPFASLWDRETGRYLIEDHLVSQAPSGTVFVRATSTAADSESRPPRLLAVGNPKLGREESKGLPILRGAEAEAEDVAALYRTSEVLKGSAATKRAFLDALRGAQIVHFAGHATTGGPGGTARLLLASDPEARTSGALHAFEIERQALPHARLVVLAACGTAAGEPSHLEGTLSVARPFLAAGVPAVVASLWDVDDATSRRFFVAFHQSLLAVGDPATALRQTQLALLYGSDETLAHPSSWAGFVSLGGVRTRRLNSP